MNIEDIDDSELLIDLEQEEFLERYQTVAESMKRTGDWYYLDGSYKGSMRLDFAESSFTRVAPPKHLGLGRSCYYDRFLEEMSVLAGHRVHQSDYMMWIHPTNPYISLNFYIDTAEAIEFSLEGVSEEDIRLAVRTGRRVRDRRELGTRFMTVWEINQVLYSDAQARTTWHLRDALTAAARAPLHGVVDPKRMVRDLPEPG